MRYWLPVFCLLFCYCTPRLRYATEAESSATDVVLYIRNVQVESGGELILRNTGSQPVLLTRPYPCSVYLALYDAQQRRLQANRKVKRYCNPAEAAPLLLAPGDTLCYQLESPRKDYDAEELRTARAFEVTYQGSITTELRDKRRKRVVYYTLHKAGMF